MSSPLRWDPSWPASRPVTEHPDFDPQLVNDANEIALFCEFGPSPMCGPGGGIEHALTHHPRWMLTPSEERRHEVIVDFVADVRAAKLDEDEERVGLAVARLLMRFSQVLRLADVARLAKCTRLEAHRAIAELSRRGLLVEIELDEGRASSHVMLVHDGLARLPSIYLRGDGWAAESTAEIEAEEALERGKAPEARCM